MQADALAGLKVIEMGQLIAGPFAGKTLCCRCANAATAAGDNAYFARKSAHAPLSQICVINLLLDYAYLG